VTLFRGADQGFSAVLDFRISFNPEGLASAVRFLPHSSAPQPNSRTIPLVAPGSAISAAATFRRRLRWASCQVLADSAMNKQAVSNSETALLQHRDEKK
jgi:hypothetical protein